MNIVSGSVASIVTDGHLVLVHVDVGATVLTSIVVDTPEATRHLEPGVPVQVIFKETEVLIGTGAVDHISLRNKLVGTISSIEQGNLLSRITVRTSIGEIVSIITSNAARELGLTRDMEVTAMIKTNEMMLSV
ncbi:MAG: TOBE domain-containing protein [Saprospiraceae bacterium]|nr:TOBE domain-containing protein [Saprospiraceae bacterium]